MTTSYPSGLDSFTNPTATDELDDEIGTRTHSEFHADTNDALEAIQAELGTDPSGAAATVKARIEATETVANAALPTATAATTYQPLDADLTAIAALTTPATSISGAAQKSSNLSDLANTATAFTNIKQAASETATGVVELATNAEVATGTDTARAVTPAGAAAAYQPLDSDLTAIAALSTTAYGRAVLALANQAALSALVDHGGVGGLSDDDHSQYVLVAGTRSSAQVVLQAGNAAHVPLIAKGAAAQSAALQQWQDSTATALASVSASGLGSFAGGVYTISVGPAATGPYIDFGGGTGVYVINRTTTSNIPLIVRGMASQSGALQVWQDSAGPILASVSAAGLASFAGVTLTDATNLVVGSTTGTKIGTATTQKLGFWNATPVVQPTNVTNPTGGATVDAEARTAIDAILSRLETIGIFAA